MVKDKIRKFLLEKAHALSEEFISNSNKAIQVAALEMLDISHIKNILLYSPFRKEVRLDLLLKELNKTSTNIYLPKILPNKNMCFNLLEESSYIKKNKYGISEVINKNYLDASEFDVMIIPFVGVDSNGLRLGYGSGYFDRALENIKDFTKRPLLVGLGYEYQVADEAYGEEHDLKYDLVITETDIHGYAKSIK
jgi:5-formyltetrahydrofolate cyclo-ligase